MRYRQRKLIGLVSVVAITIFLIVQNQITQPATAPTAPTSTQSAGNSTLARTELEKLAVKGRAPKTDYARTQFGDGWAQVNGCDTRNIILHRDMVDAVVSEDCKVTSGTLHDPYTGKDINFARGANTSELVQIDHVVALSNAWQTGAQQLTVDQRIALANDPLELLAVDGAANQQKSDGDAATWLPANKAFRCQYVARQIAVKIKYQLWVVSAEKSAMQTILGNCPEQALPTASY